MQLPQIAKLLGATAAALGGLALVCHAVWDLGDERPSSTAANSASAIERIVRKNEQSTAVGQRLYRTRCVRCHGDQGHGDGAEMANSPVRPRDLASSSWRAGAERGALRKVIVEGIPDHKMPGSAGTIPAHDLDLLVDYVLSLEMNDLLLKAGFSPDMGQSAPALAVRDGDGNDGSLGQLRGKVVLVAFWGTTCPPCLEELPDLEALAGRYEQTDFVVLPVCVGETDARTVQEVGARYAPGLTVYVAPDDSVRERFGVRHLPQAVLVDREGRMLGRCYGGQRWKGQDFDRLLAACRRRTDPLETLAGRVVSSME